MVMSMSFAAKKTIPAIVVATDGSGDFTDVKEAIESVTAAGALIHIRVGTYTISSKVTIPKDFITIQGEGFGTVLLRNGDHIMFENGDSVDFTTFHNLQLDGGLESTDPCIAYDGAGLVVQGVRLKGVGTSGAAGIGIKFVRPAGWCRISECEFINQNRDDDVMVHFAPPLSEGPYYSWFTRNFANFLRGTMLKCEDTTRVIIADNIAVANSTPTNGIIELDGADRTLIHGNISQHAYSVWIKKTGDTNTVEADNLIG